MPWLQVTGRVGYRGGKPEPRGETVRPHTWMLILALVGGLGCGGSGTGGNPAPSGRVVLHGEAMRQLTTMTQSTYQHTTDVNEAAGIYRYDCSGFFDYALNKVLPAAYTVLDQSIVRTPHPIRPLAQDIHAFFAGLGTGAATRGWRRLTRVQELLPGDIVVWLQPPGSDTSNTGHVMIVREAPVSNPARPTEYLVRVIDSSMSGHASDTRSATDTGLGSGTIGLLTDGSGLPVGYRWSGGLYSDVTANIELGRLE